MYNNGNIDIIIPYNSKQNQLFERLAGLKKSITLTVTVMTALSTVTKDK